VRAGNVNQETAELLDKRDLMVKQLSEKIEVRTYTQDRGAIALYTANGEALLDANPRVLYYDTPNFVSSTTSFGALSIFGRHEMDPDTGKPLPTATGLVMVTGGVRARLTPELQNDAVPDADQQIVSKLDGGRIQGLIDVRDRILPELNDELQELADTLRFAVNAAHNDGTAWPPPAALTGTNQDLSSFAGATRSGSATVAVIDHGDGTTLLAFEVDVAAAADDNDIVTQLNAGLGAFGTAAIGPDGNLTITLANPDQGLALAEGDSSITVADAAGRDRDFGFSHYFGLNDMFVVDGVEPSNLEVRADLAANPTRLSAAKLDVTTPPLTAVLGGVGDNRAARAVSQSLNAEYDMLARGKLPATNVSLGNYASQMIATAAIDAKQASDVAERDVVMSDALQFKEASFSGVNMDEELARLIQLQQAYTVAAKIVSAVDEMLDQLINAAR
jgi:flagellar hook-associated protein 1 FlgK